MRENTHKKVLIFRAILTHKSSLSPVLNLPDIYQRKKRKQSIFSTQFGVRSQKKTCSAPVYRTMSTTQIIFHPRQIQRGEISFMNGWFYLVLSSPSPCQDLLYQRSVVFFTLLFVRKPHVSWWFWKQNAIQHSSFSLLSSDNKNGQIMKSWKEWVFVK